MLFIQNQKVMKKMKVHLNQIIHILFLLMMVLNINMMEKINFVVNLKEQFQENLFHYILMIINQHHRIFLLFLLLLKVDLIQLKKVFFLSLQLSSIDCFSS
jgi:hypothetical protein